MAENITVEKRIKETYQMSVTDFFQDCINQGMDTSEIALLIRCSVSNLRRIARKHSFTFCQPANMPKLYEDDLFKLPTLNSINFLYRLWEQPICKAIEIPSEEELPDIEGIIQKISCQNKITSEVV